jgi:hypothetical protein
MYVYPQNSLHVRGYWKGPWGKTHDFCEFVARIESTVSEEKTAFSDDCAAEFVVTMKNY